MSFTGKMRTPKFRRHTGTSNSRAMELLRTPERNDKSSSRSVVGVLMSPLSSASPSEASSFLSSSSSSSASFETPNVLSQASESSAASSSLSFNGNSTHSSQTPTPSGSTVSPMPSKTPSTPSLLDQSIPSDICFDGIDFDGIDFDDIAFGPPPKDNDEWFYDNRIQMQLASNPLLRQKLEGLTSNVDRFCALIDHVVSALGE